MKKIFVYTILLWTMLLISSCVQPLDVPENIRYDGTFGIDLSVVCSAPGTKVVESEKPGVDSLNENKLSHVDWFIFKSDSEASLDSALLHGRADANDIVQASTSDGLQTENIKLKGPILMDDLVSDSQRSFYVYTIANLPSDYSHNDIGTKTLAELKALPIVANFNVNPFVKQNNFVMQGGQAFTFENSDQGNLKKVTAELKRSAAKVTINMNIAPAIDQMTTLPTGGRQYVKTWYPSLGDVQVYLSFANDSTTLEGVPQQYNIKNFFTYNRAAFKPAYSYVNAAGGSQVVTPGGSVPTVTPAWDNSNWKWNVTGTPFYSYPMSWTSDSPQAPFLKVILKWTSYKEDESSFVYDNEGKFLRTGRNPSTSQMIDAAKEFYYKIPIPAEVLNSNEWYHLTFAVDILGSTADELPVELGGRYCVVDWSNSNVQAGGNLNQGRYLDIASDTFYIYGVDNIKIPVISSHDIAVSVTGVTYNDYSNYTSGQTYPTPRSGFNNFPFNIAGRDASAVPNGRQEFSFSHHVIDINSAGTGDNRPDVSDYTFTVLVYHKDLYPENVPSENQPYVKKVTIIQQPPLRIKSETNTYTDGGHVFVNNNTSNNQQWNSVTGRLGTGQNNNPNMYIVSTSVAPEGRVIADPRSTVEDNLDVSGAWSYNNGNRLDPVGTTGPIRHYHPSDYSKTEISKKKIAPKFRIASSFGKGYATSFSNMQHRCASYQEFGYPAGRWRIPTMAELEFMMTLSGLGLIPTLFQNNATYFTADGGTLTPRTTGKPDYDANFTGTSVARCVYDEWYWGSDKISNMNAFTWGDIAY